MKIDFVSCKSWGEALVLPPW